MKYEIRDRFGIKGKAETVGATLDTIRTKNGGRMTAADVVAEARKKTSPIHDEFEWDDTEAARLHRLEQARYLIRAVVVVPEDGETDFSPVRAFVRIGEPDKQRGGTYASITDVMQDEDARAELLARAKGELVGWRKRYADLQEFAAIVSAIDTFVAA